MEKLQNKRTLFQLATSHMSQNIICLFVSTAVFKSDPVYNNNIYLTKNLWVRLDGIKLILLLHIYKEGGIMSVKPSMSPSVKPCGPFTYHSTIQHAIVLHFRVCCLSIHSFLKYMYPRQNQSMVLVSTYQVYTFYSGMKWMFPISLEIIHCFVLPATSCFKQHLTGHNGAEYSYVSGTQGANTTPLWYQHHTRKCEQPLIYMLTLTARAGCLRYNISKKLLT